MAATSAIEKTPRLYHHPRGQDLAGDFNVLMAALELAKVAQGESSYGSTEKNDPHPKSEMEGLWKPLNVATAIISGHINGGFSWIFP